MSTLRNTRALAWVVPLLLGLGGTVQAQEGFWDDVTPLGPAVNSTFHEWGPSISPDGLTLYFASRRPGGKGDFDMYVATREAIDQPFGKLRILEEVNTAGQDAHPDISSDGLTLYISGASQATRKKTTDEEGNPVPFGEPMDLGPPVSPEAFGPNISSNGLTLYFNRPGGNLYMATRAAADQRFEEIERLEEFNSPFNDGQPSISRDGLAIFWCSAFGGRGGEDDIWWATRARATDEDGNRVPFGAPRNLGAPVNTGFECAPDISADWPDPGAKLYFVRCAAADNCDIFQATWHPDCNGNGVKDVEDIRDGNSFDCNENGIPDTCDIATGTSRDENANDTPDECEARFLRGDPNDDGTVDLSDAVFTLNWLFLGGPAPGCVASTNTNGDDAVDLSDPVYLLSHLFLGGPPPVAPFPECGPGTLPTDAGTCETTPVNC